MSQPYASEQKGTSAMRNEVQSGMNAQQQALPCSFCAMTMHILEDQ